MRSFRFILFVIIGAVIFINYVDERPISNETKMSKSERIAGMAEMEFLMTKDPATGEVPKHKLFAIKREILKKNNLEDSRSGEEWISRGPDNVSGRTRAVLIDANDPTGNTIIAGSVSGGLWKCTDTNTNPVWERLNYDGNPSIVSIAQDPNDPAIIYVGTGEGWFNSDAYQGDGIYKSVDSGDSWDRLVSTSNGDFNHVQKLLFTDEGNLLAATKESGVQMSQDGGISWTGVLTSSNQGATDRAADLEMTSDGTIFAGMGIFIQDGVYRSDDAGFTWDYMDMGVTNYGRIEIGVSLNEPDLVIALLQSSTNGRGDRMMKSQDKGVTWELFPVTTTDTGAGIANFQAFYNFSIAIDPSNSDIMYLGIVAFYKTIDGGQTWFIAATGNGNQNASGTLSFMHYDNHSIQYVGGSSDKMYFSNDGGLYMTEDGSSLVPDITDINLGYISTQLYAADLSPDEDDDFYLTGAQDNGSHQVTGPDVGTAAKVNGGDGAICHISQLDRDIQITAYQRGRFTVTFDGYLTNGTFYDPGGNVLFINPTDLDDENLYLYSSINYGFFYRTNLITEESEIIEVDVAPSERLTAFQVDANNSDVLYIGTANGKIIKTTNPRSDNPSYEILFEGNGYTRNIDIDSENGDRMICTYSNYGVESVWLTEDAGISWTSLQGDLPDMPVRWGIFSPADPNEILIATELGVWSGRTDEGPVTWTVASSEIGLSRVNMLRSRDSDQQIVAATYGRGLFTSNCFSADMCCQAEEICDGIDNNGDGQIDELLINAWIGPDDRFWYESKNYWSLCQFPNSCQEVVIDQAKTVNVKDGNVGYALTLKLEGDAILNIQNGAAVEVKE